jgi:hypothetical protein
MVPTIQIRIPFFLVASFNQSVQTATRLAFSLGWLSANLWLRGLF